MRLHCTRENSRSGLRTRATLTALLPCPRVHAHRNAPILSKTPLCTDVVYFFFFQAEDGIRDVAVTGVQTCALPIYVVLNGIQAMPRGGTLTISAQREDEIVITDIRDQGSGISPEIQEKIFELYFTTKKGGSGIGLAQTYQILQWHDSSVDFETAQDPGTTFHLRLLLVVSHFDVLKETA